MDIMLLALAGISLGGLVNALADSLPQGRLLARPRYGNGAVRPLAAWLGIGAFLFKLRRPPRNGSRGNARPLSWRYPLTELALSALMLATDVVAGDQQQIAPGQQLLWHFYAAVFVLLVVIDIENRRILLRPVFLASALAIVDAAAFPQHPPDILSSLAGGVVGGVTYSLVYLGGQIYARVVGSRRELPTAFGKGDVYLMALGGLIVGFGTVFAAMAIAIFLGGLGALTYIAALRLLGRRYEYFTPLPYAPYILAATYLVMLFPSPFNLVI